MAQVNKNTLKEYFQTGSIPNQQDFSDLIDSLVNIQDDSSTVKTMYESNSNTNNFTDAEKSSLLDLNSGATLANDDTKFATQKQAKDAINVLDTDLQGQIDVINQAQDSGALGYETKALMDADLTPNEGALALVTNDSTASNNNWYRKVGASGTGSWIKRADFYATTLDPNDTSEAVTGKAVSDHTGILIKDINNLNGDLGNWTSKNGATLTVTSDAVEAVTDTQSDSGLILNGALDINSKYLVSFDIVLTSGTAAALEVGSSDNKLITPTPIKRRVYVSFFTTTNQNLVIQQQSSAGGQTFQVSQLRLVKLDKSNSTIASGDNTQIRKQDVALTIDPSVPSPINYNISDTEEITVYLRGNIYLDKGMYYESGASGYSLLVGSSERSFIIPSSQSLYLDLEYCKTLGSSDIVPDEAFVLSKFIGANTNVKDSFVPLVERWKETDLSQCRGLISELYNQQLSSIVQKTDINLVAGDTNVINYNNHNTEGITVSITGTIFIHKGGYSFNELRSSDKFRSGNTYCRLAGSGDSFVLDRTESLYLDIREIFEVASGNFLPSSAFITRTLIGSDTQSVYSGGVDKKWLVPLIERWTEEKLEHCSGLLADMYRRKSNLKRIENIELTASANIPEGYDSVNSAFSIDSERSNTIRVFGVWGQSNAEGRGDSTLSPICNNGYVWNGSNLTSLSDPVGGASSGSAWTSFGKQYYVDTKKIPVIVENATGGSGMYSGSTDTSNHWDDGGNLYSPAETALQNALDNIDSSTYDVELGGIIWVQGERDAQAIDDNDMTKANYKDALENLISKYRTQFGSTAPFYIVQTGTKDSGDTTGFEEIREAQEEIADADGYTFLAFDKTKNFPAYGYMSDDLHYNQAGYNLIGRESAKEVAFIEA